MAWKEFGGYHNWLEVSLDPYSLACQHKLLHRPYSSAPVRSCEDFQAVHRALEATDLLRLLPRDTMLLPGLITTRVNGSLNILEYSINLSLGHNKYLRLSDQHNGSTAINPSHERDLPLFVCVAGLVKADAVYPALLEVPVLGGGEALDCLPAGTLQEGLFRWEQIARPSMRHCEIGGQWVKAERPNLLRGNADQASPWPIHGMDNMSRTQLPLTRASIVVTKSQKESGRADVWVGPIRSDHLKGHQVNQLPLSEVKGGLALF